MGVLGDVMDGTVELAGAVGFGLVLVFAAIMYVSPLSRTFTATTDFLVWTTIVALLWNQTLTRDRDFEWFDAVGSGAAVALFRGVM